MIFSNKIQLSRNVSFVYYINSYKAFTIDLNIKNKTYFVDYWRKAAPKFTFGITRN